MKQIQTELPNFQVYVDGQLQGPTAADKALETAKTVGHGTLELLSHLARPVASTIAEMALHVEMDLHDYQYGTHVRKDYLEQKKALATAALRDEVGL
jgi:hypothetical protein